MPESPAETASHPDLDPHHALPTPDATGATVTDSAHLLPATAAEPPARSGLLRKILIPLVLLAAIGFAVWRIHTNNTEAAATSSRAAGAANRPIPVLTSLVQERTIPVYLTALGTVTAYNTVTLRSRVDGQLLRVNFSEGQPVRQGQLLLQIDPRPYQATLAQAEGQLAKDQATAKNAQAEAARYTALYQAGVVSKESEQTQLTNQGTAAGSIQADLASIQAAKVNLSYTSIYAPINGVVGLRQVDPGNIVHASDTNGLIVITQIHPIAVIFTLPEDQLPQVQQAMRVGGHGAASLAVEAYDRSDQHKIADGKLLTIDNQIDTTTGTAKLKAVFDNADNSLYPNQFVNVRLVVQERPNAIIVPTAAIQTGTQGTFVFVVHPGPTPANKRPAGAAAPDTSGAAPSGGGQRGSGSGGGKAGGAGQNGAGGGGSGAPSRPPSHVDAVPVHVDFAQGPNSILSPGALKGGDQVVIDGQEKLIDGGNVVPQPSGGSAPGGGGNGPGRGGQGRGAGGANGGTTPGATPGNPNGMTPATTPSTPGGPPPSTPGAQPGQHHRGQPSGSQGAGSSATGGDEE
jgi:multidrug efflux system membrane fusion protein